jgi:hypothetical protein
MRRVILCAVFLFVYCNFLSAAEENNWVFRGIFGVNYSQTSVSNNWSGSETDSKNWGLKLDASAEKNFTSSTWLNALKEEFGKSETHGTSEQVSADLIDFSSIFTLHWSIYADPYIGFNMITVHNTFHDPVTYRESAGIGWAFINRKKHRLKLRVGAAYTQDFKSGEETVRETGVEAVSGYSLTLSRTAKFVSEARFFTGLKKGPNLRWDNNLYLKASEYVTVALNFLEIYNEKRVPRPQWAGDIETRFMVMLGLSYNLF